MAVSKITITYNAETGEYTTQVQAMIDKNKQLNKEMNDAVNGLQVNINNFTSAFSKIGAAMVTVNQALELAAKAWRPIRDAITATVQAAAEYQQVTTQLSTSLEMTGRKIPVERFDEFAEEMQKVSRFSHESILAATAFLASMTRLDEQGLQRAIKGAMALATVLHVDLDTAIRMMEKGALGFEGALKRAGIVIDTSLPLQERFNSLLEQAAAKWPRVTAEAQTYAGVQDQVKNSTDDLLKLIGQPFIAALTALGQGKRDLIERGIEWLKANRELLPTIAALIAAIGTGVVAATLVGALAALVVHINAVGAAVVALMTNPVGLAAFIALAGVGAVTFALLKNRLAEFTEAMTAAGRSAGLTRMVDELTRLDKMRSDLLAKQQKGTEERRVTENFSILVPIDKAATARQLADIESQIEKQKQLIQARAALMEELDRPKRSGKLPPPPPDKDAQEALKRQLEALEQYKTKLAQAVLQDAEFAKSQGDTSDAVLKLRLALIDQEAQQERVNATQNKTISVIGPYINQLATMRKELLIQVDAQAKQKEIGVDLLRENEQQEANLKKMLDLYGSIDEKIKANTLSQIEYKQSMADLNAELVTLQTGSTEAGEKIRLLGAIEAAEAKKRENEKNLIPNYEDLNRQLDLQIEVYRTKLSKVGEVTLNLGQTISSAIGDAFEGVILGTSKLADVGKNLLTAIGRDIIKFFSDSISKKLGFEQLIISNVSGLAPQVNQALLNGAAGVPTQQGGLGGFLQSILGFGGSSLPNVGGAGWTLNMGGAFPAVPLGGVNNAGLFGMFPGVSLGGLAGAGMAGWGIGGMINGMPGSIGGSIGSIAGTLVGSATGATSAITSALSGVLGATIGGLLGSMIIPGVGMILGALLSLLMPTPNPTVIVRTKMEGFFYDAIENLFKFGNITSKGKGIDISGSAVRQTTDAVQSALEEQSRVWTDILNLFPTVVHKFMIPTLELANAQLNRAFARMKFTEGGSMNIEQELKQFMAQEAPGGFFAATRPVIGAGLEAALTMAGLPSAAEMVGINWGDVGELRKPGMYRKGGYPGLVPPPYNKKDTEGMQKFVEAISTFADLTGKLATVSSAGLVPFLPTADLETVSAEIQRVLSITKGEQLAPAVEQMQKALQPITDYLQQAVQDAANAFGNGMMAAMEAVTASDAQAAFFDSLGKGTKDIVFKGIVQAFLASANFNDLLAPVQKIIQDFTAQAVTTLQTPDIAAFEAQILPAIDAILARGEALAPLVEEFQKLGQKIAEVIPTGAEITTTEAATGLATTAKTALANGIAAAFAAASASDAELAFVNNLGASISSAIVQALAAGFTESIFKQIGLQELLKPIEDLMTQFTEEGGPTGVAIRETVLPIMDEILSRAEDFKPVIDTFQQFGIDLAKTFTQIPQVTEVTAQLTEAANIFGQGISEALNAATQADSMNAFLNAIGEGTRDVIFRGIIDAFTQSAAIKDLLKPIQDIVADFTTQAAGGIFDVAAFRGEIAPAITIFTSQLMALTPLIQELAGLGLNIRSALPLFTTGTQQTTGPTTINVTIGSVNDERDAQTLARSLAFYLQGGLSPQ